jgi:hypothetical protein
MEVNIGNSGTSNQTDNSSSGSASTDIGSGSPDSIPAISVHNQENILIETPLNIDDAQKNELWTSVFFSNSIGYNLGKSIASHHQTATEEQEQAEIRRKQASIFLLFKLHDY